MIQKLLVFFALLSTFSLTSQTSPGHQIRLKIDGFEGNELYLGYHYGDKQYLKDTVQINEDGYFVFEGEERLDGGVYLAVMPPDNKFFQLMISDHEQHFTAHVNYEEPTKNAQFINAPDNQLFYEYLDVLASKRPQAEQLNTALKEAQEIKKPTQTLERQLKELNQSVRNYQHELIAKHPKTLTAAVIKASLDLEVPEFTGEEQDIQLQRWKWYKAHWFDQINMADPRMLRSPVLYQKIDHYINKLTVQHPDSISAAIDRVLALVQPSEETFKYYLIHFLNYYAKSKIVGMDAVYVHIADKYYRQGLAPWTEEEQLNKIVKNANTLKPILIGKNSARYFDGKGKQRKATLA